MTLYNNLESRSLIINFKASNFELWLLEEDIDSCWKVWDVKQTIKFFNMSREIEVSSSSKLERVCKCLVRESMTLDEI